MRFSTIAFDADDTLWHSENHYIGIKGTFKQLLVHYGDSDRCERVYDRVEIGNLPMYGYGMKGFILSLIESAIEISAGRITGAEIQKIISLGKESLSAEVELFEHARETIQQLALDYPLMLITKGDLVHQEAKIAQSGLRSYFRHIEIVSDKTPAIYEALLVRHGITPQEFLMVGDSLRSDIIPIVALGAHAVHIPNKNPWHHENRVDLKDTQGKYFELAHIGLLPALIDGL